MSSFDDLKKSARSTEMKVETEVKTFWTVNKVIIVACLVCGSIGFILAKVW